ncbi:ABC-2 transporter permease [Bariatricus sp. SGI.154]|uniref:ABC-2 transporter permease n=1 Tax=Bariatricus sp. SGI.154 TaxID=3420549 RepID=UPI003CFEEA46
MKGLLVKDIRLMLNQKQFFGVVALMAVVFLSVYSDPSFVISYITLMFSIFTISTISYDEYENGMCYLFTLPISRKGYVREKYIFGVITTLLSFTVISVLSFIASAIRHIGFDVKEWIFTGVTSLLLITLVLAVNIPLQLKFEAERSRMAMLVTFAGAFVVAYLVVKITSLVGVDMVKLIERLAETNLKGCVVFACAVWALGMLISYLVAVRVMEKKDF